MKVTGIILMFLSVLTVASSQAAEKLIFSAIKGSVYTLVSERVLKEAYERLNIEIEIIQYPAARALHSSNQGTVDGELFRIDGMNKKYPNLLQVSVPVNKLEGMVFTKNIEFTVNGWESLKPYKTGIQRGIRFAERGTGSIEGLHTYVADTNEQLFRILEKERTDIIVAARLNGLKTMRELNISGIRLLEPPIESYPLYHYLHKKNSHLMPRITAVLQEMEEEGLIQKIRELFIMEHFGNNEQSATKIYQDREKPHGSPLPHHAAYVAT